MMMFARLTRIIPLLVMLAVLAGVVYLVVSARRSPTRAKEVLIKIFLVLMSVITAFCALFTLYALFEGNEAVFDLGMTFLVAALVGLAIVLICRAVFLKHHPGYRDKAQRARTKHRFFWHR